MEELDLLHGNLKKQIALFALPLMCSNLIQVLFNMADVMVVGKFAGSMALGAVGSTTMMITLFTAFIFGVSGGINVVTAIHLGSGNQEKIRKTVNSSLLVSIGIGIVVLLIGVFCGGPILHLLNTKADLFDKAVLYVKIYSLGMPALALYNYGNAVFSAYGDTKRPLKYLSISGVLNVILNLIFVIIFKLEVAGVALASILAQYLSAFLINRDLLKSTTSIQLDVHHFDIDIGIMRHVLALGLPSGLQNAVFYIANMFVQMGVNSFDSTVVAGVSAAANVDNLIFDIMVAFYTAGSSFMGQNLGAGNKERIIKSYWYATGYAFVVALVLGSSIAIFGRGFLFLFTSDPAVVEAGMVRLTIMGYGYCLSAFMDGSIAASRALGKTIVPTIIVILGSCVFRVIWIYTIFAYYHTTTSLYLLYIASWTISAIGETAYFLKVYKKKCLN